MALRSLPLRLPLLELVSLLPRPFPVWELCFLLCLDFPNRFRKSCSRGGPGSPGMPLGGGDGECSRELFEFFELSETVWVEETHTLVLRPDLCFGLVDGLGLT